MAVTQCEIRGSSQGALLEICFVPDTGTSGPGSFSARFRGPGDPDFSAPFVPLDSTGANLRSDGSGFGFDKGREGPDRWFLVLVAPGDTGPSVWWSADGGKTWTRS